MRAEGTVSVPREERVHRPGVGGRRNTGDLYRSRTLGASAVGDRTRTYTARFLSEDFETGSRRKLPTDPQSGDWRGSHWVVPRSPRTSQLERSPANQAPDFPDSLTSYPCCLGSAGRSKGARGSRVVWLCPFERVPSFLWSS